MMFLSSHPLDKSENWDTNWARKVLKVPQDQLNKIDSILEWSTNQIFTTENTESVGVHIVTSEKSPLLQCATALESLNKTNSPAKNTDNPEVSNLLQTIEYKLTRSTSLNPLNLFDKPSEYTGLKSADSAQNNIEALSSDSLAISETVSQNPKPSKSSRSNLNEKKLIDTSIVSSKLNKMDFCSTSFSQPEMHYGSIPESIKPVEKLTDRILNHKYLKGSVNSTKSDETEPFEVLVQGEENSNVLDKRLMLLEKRFSSSEEHASAEKSSKIEELSKPIFQAPKDDHVQGYVPSTVSSAGDLHNDDHIQVPLSSAKVQEPVLDPNKEKENDVSKDGNSSCSNQAVTLSVSNNNESIIVGGDHEETFNSQLIPCGQPLPASSCSSKKANIETCDLSIDKSNIASSAVENVDIQKSPPPVRGRSSGTKRKRKSKGETAKRIKDAHAINFSVDQVRNMLEMIKMLHST